MSAVLKWAKNWLKNERSESVITSHTMMMLAAILAAIGIGWLVVKYVRESGVSILQRLTDTANNGLDPNTPPSVVESWE